ncbi:Trp operon repressor [Limihaloglobus sulfuriphilus]|uniref:Trp operon repressor n=1 Tax=Limihaloglobus sulfuriphilus TaxID=1851148 RepID=A0A1Q2MG01_9BACT|nr:Trp family transcriptional regulator [Limihaloglobus sulfuriphilus]AQQ71192.1 Trp operon repressor [Limihaloglobus sulfuriphilus]
MSDDKDLLEIIAEMDDPAELGKFFQELFTKSEIEKFKKRWKLIKLIDQGMPQREIAKKMRISLCKITRGSKILKDKNSITRQLLGH